MPTHEELLRNFLKQYFPEVYKKVEHRSLTPTTFEDGSQGVVFNEDGLTADDIRVIHGAYERII